METDSAGGLLVPLQRSRTGRCPCWSSRVGCWPKVRPSLASWPGATDWSVATTSRRPSSTPPSTPWATSQQVMEVLLSHLELIWISLQSLFTFSSIHWVEEIIFTQFLINCIKLKWFFLYGLVYYLWISSMLSLDWNYGWLTDIMYWNQSLFLKSFLKSIQPRTEKNWKMKRTLLFRQNELSEKHSYPFLKCNHLFAQDSFCKSYKILTVLGKSYRRESQTTPVGVMTHKLRGTPKLEDLAPLLSPSQWEPLSSLFVFPSVSKSPSSIEIIGNWTWEADQ